MTNKNSSLKAFERLLILMDELREKCPWDKKQTLESLKNLTIEEVYELTEAISENNSDEIKKELGDLLLHIIFYCKIGSEHNLFDIETVCNSLCDKLIERHPHIYGNVKVTNEKEVKKNWEKIKLKQGSKGVLSGVPKNLPAMIKSYRIQEKASGVGFDWSTAEEVFEKVKEELKEFESEINNNCSEKAHEEFGDLLFSLVNYARFVGINPEQALEDSNKKFIRRFKFIELKLDKPISESNLTELNLLWEKAKIES